MDLIDHPDSDHLHIAQVDTGDDELRQIVCGAPNIEKGQTVIVAMPGARIADNQKKLSVVKCAAWFPMA